MHTIYNNIHVYLQLLLLLWHPTLFFVMIVNLQKHNQLILVCLAFPSVRPGKLDCLFSSSTLIHLEEFHYCIHLWIPALFPYHVFLSQLTCLLIISHTIISFLIDCSMHNMLPVYDKHRGRGFCTFICTVLFS